MHRESERGRDGENEREIGGKSGVRDGGNILL